MSCVQGMRLQCRFNGHLRCGYLLLIPSLALLSPDLPALSPAELSPTPAASGQTLGSALPPALPH